MKLSINHPVVRFAYWFSDFGPPSRTNLCNLFWRVILRTPLILLCLGLTASLVIFFLIAYTSNVLGGAIAVILGLGIVWLLAYTFGIIHAIYTSDSLVGETARALKHKYCPIIELEQQE